MPNTIPAAGEALAREKEPFALRVVSRDTEIAELNIADIQDLALSVRSLIYLTRLAFALDDWAEHTTFKSVAHVYPASTERGVYLMNMKTEVSRETPERANARLWDLLAEAGRIIAARPELKVDYVQVDENGAHWFHRIPGEARRPR